ALRFTLASKDLRFAARIRGDFNHLAVGAGADALRRFAAPGAKTLGFGKTLGAHALVSLLRDFLRQIGTADAHVDDLKAQRRRVRTKLVGDLAHHRSAFFRQGGLETAQTVDTAQCSVETGAQALFRQRYAARHGKPEPARIGDAIGDEGVDLIEAAARHLNTDVVEIEAQDAVLDHLDAVRLQEGEWQLEVDARF